MAMFSAMMFRQSLAAPQFPARRWPQRSLFRTVPQEKHSSCAFNSRMTIYRKLKRSVILPLTFHIYRRVAAYTCSGFGWVALGDVTQMYAESPVNAAMWVQGRRGASWQVLTDNLSSGPAVVLASAWAELAGQSKPITAATHPNTRCVPSKTLALPPSCWCETADCE